MAVTDTTVLWYARDGVWQRRGRPDHVAGAVHGGYYKAGLADIRPDVQTYAMNVRGFTTYTSWAQAAQAFPVTAWADAAARGGMVPNYVWEPKVYGASPPAQYPAPNATMNNWSGAQFYGWTQITSGALDQLLDDAADAVKALPYTINIQIASERDTDHYTGGIINGVAYTWPQLDALANAAVAYIISRFKNRGVANATFSAGMAGFDQAAFVRSYCPEVDVIQYNAYNHSTWNTPQTVFSRTYNWLPLLPAGSETKPVWIAEWGCDTDARRPAYFQAVPAAIAALSRIQYMSYFNATWGAIPVGDTASYQALADCYNDPLFGGTG